MISIENKINTASIKIGEIEYKIYDDLKKLFLDFEYEIRLSADSIGELDFYLTLGFVSREENWVKPIRKKSNELFIVQGRHPIVEKNVNQNSEFIPNDCI